MMPADMLSEVEQVKSIVARYFPIYDVRVTYQSVTVFITPDLTTLESKFDDMRVEMNQKMYIPFLSDKGGEHTITVIRKDDRAKKGLWLNSILLAVTAVTMVIAGASLWGAYSGDNDLFSANNLIWGAIYFAIPLMLILGVHELSHFYMAKRHKVAASLPFFIPSIPPLGTLGAFISLRDPIPNRKALVDIGIAGPIGGLLVTLPIAAIGLWLTSLGTPGTGYIPEEGGIAIIVQPLYMLFMLFFPLPENVAMHPMAFAAWVGFLVTAINLLPAGQLDGGHVARGFLGENARYLSYAVMGVLFFMGMFFYTGWLLFAIIVLFLGVRHPQPLNDITKLDMKRKVLGVAAIVMLIVCFSPIPMIEVPANYDYQIDVQGGTTINATAGSTLIILMDVRNVGNTNYTMSMMVLDVPTEWGRGIYRVNDTSNLTTERVSFLLPYQGSEMVALKLIIPATAVTGEVFVLLDSSSKSSNGSSIVSQDLRFTINVV